MICKKKILMLSSKYRQVTGLKELYDWLAHVVLS